MQTKISTNDQNEIISAAIDAKYPILTNCEHNEGDDRRQLRDERFSSLCNAVTSDWESLTHEGFRAKCDAFLAA